MIKKLEQSSGKVIGFSLSGKLHDEDYHAFVPQVERVIEREGTARLLAHFHDFHGWDLHALWDDIKFSTKHCNDVERIAMVGDSTWQEWMSKVCKPFTKAKVEYFDNLDAAWAWLKEE